jgi:RHS repeat-associated protein
VTDIDRYGYSCDRRGSRLTRSNALAAAFSEVYGYDPLNQLQSSVRGTFALPTASQRWQFDALGNWTTVTTDGVDQCRAANAQNELTQVGSTVLTYSATGNMTTDAQGRTLVYDAWNRLVSISNASATQIAAYQYDGMNRRIVEQVVATGVSSAPVRDLFYSQAWQVLEERIRTSGGDIPATADIRYVWSRVYVDALVARDRNADNSAETGPAGLEERVYALQDANCNTTAVLVASGVPGFGAGEVINRFAYTPYGESQALTASWATPPTGLTSAVPWSHLFQGLQFTEVTALAYVRHRDYSASLGRFIEIDPIGFKAGDNNWYRFVGNGPVGGLDPDGTCPEVPVVLAAGGDDADDDDISPIFGGPAWRDWGWAIDWGVGRKSPLIVEGSLLAEFRQDHDVQVAVRELSDQALRTPPPGGMPTCDGVRVVSFPVAGQTKSTIQLQDTIYSIGNTHLKYTGECVVEAICEDHCGGTATLKRMRTKCTLTFRIEDSWQNPIGDRADWLVNWWRDDGYPIRGNWTETFTKDSVD